jgi:2-C-methyl-D-erythritol 4-phosphate cytidylyltransferase / 2-C-methyl-D-erythritol 2,4-cyclodiphosphate synthase
MLGRLIVPRALCKCKLGVTNCRFAALGLTLWPRLWTWSGPLKIAALIVAAGRGSRAVALGSAPKQYVAIGGVPVLQHTVQVFNAVDAIDAIQVVIHPDDEKFYRECLGPLAAPLAPPVQGGATRQASVLAGLEALATLSPDLVLIHDAARPFVSAQTIANVIAALTSHSGAIAAVPLADTLKRADATGTIADTIDRQGLWRAQTPQGFRFSDILKAHRAAAAAGRSDFTDDAAIAEWAGLKVALVEDSAENIKLTTAEDIAAADRRLRYAMSDRYETRTGTGFDVHRFTDGDHVWLGGVMIPHTHKLEGHSDADVVLHALTDALLGTIGDGDIGQHFPPSDPKWKGAASMQFLADAARRVAAKGGRITNVDITVLAEAPRIGPHRPAMQEAIAMTLGLTTDRVGVKATTTEGMGFTGRREGIAAMAIATVTFPATPA